MKPAPRPAKAAKQATARPASAGPTASAAESLAKISPARSAAFEILTRVAANKGHSDELLHSACTSGLTPEDRNLATALVMGVLRWQIALDARLGKLVDRPDQRLAEPVALALRLGSFQLLHMDRIPAHAVLNESVELCRAAGHPHAAGMVNAILRKLAAKPTSQSRDVGHPLRNVPIFESTAAFAERLAHPLWLVERWVAAYGRDAALAICDYDQREPQSGALFAAPAESTVLTPHIDDGSRLVAELAAAALPGTSAVPRIWDCCAAPGGKTLILALRHPAAEILATDISAKRLALTAGRLRQYPYAINVRTEVADATQATDPVTHYDLILCDVPCTGTGTLARNPEIRHRLRPEDLARQCDRQRAILSGAARRLAPGGRIVYSTCSLEIEENEQVVDGVASTTNLRRVPIAPLLANLAAANILSAEIAATLTASAISADSLRTLPGLHPCDGFFAAILERN